MTRELAPQTPEVVEGETLLFSVDWRGKLDSGELLTGSPTVVEEDQSDLTISAISRNSSEVTIRNEVVPIDNAIQYVVTGFLAATKTYTIKMTVTTDAGSGMTKIGRVKVKAVS